jgi:hypothetical protein
MSIKNKILGVATISLAGVIVCMMVMFVIAILDPTVDDKLVFDVIGPAFQTIVGGFIGLITGINIGKTEENNELE